MFAAARGIGIYPTGWIGAHIFGHCVVVDAFGLVIRMSPGGKPTDGDGGDTNAFVIGVIKVFEAAGGSRVGEPEVGLVVHVKGLVSCKDIPCMGKRLYSTGNI